MSWLWEKSTILIPHSIITLINQGRGHHWLFNLKMTQYQRLLCTNPHITLEIINTQLSHFASQSNGFPSIHDCIKIVDKVFSSWGDLTQYPVVHKKVKYFTDRSSFVLEGVQLGSIHGSDDKFCGRGTASAYQNLTVKAELTLLTRAPLLVKNKKG